MTDSNDPRENRHQSAALTYSAVIERIQTHLKQVDPTLSRGLNRRDFLKLASLGMMLAAAGHVMPQRTVAQDAPATPGDLFTRVDETRRTLPNGVAAGDVTTTSAVLWTRSTAPGAVTFEVALDEDFNEVLQTLSAEVSDPSLPVKVEVEDLTPGSAYVYRVTDADETTLTGRFRTPAAPGQKVGLRFGVTGDWRGELRPYPAVANASDHDLDFFVLHGDTIYADIPSIDFPAQQARTVEEFRIKHNEVMATRFGVNAWADLRGAVPVFATIDDHEVTNDFAGGAPVASDPRFNGEDETYLNQTSLYRNGMQAFFEYMPLRDTVYTGTGDDRMENRPKLYRYQTYGDDAAVFMLDARSFRDQAVEGTDDIFNQQAVQEFLASTFEPGRTMLGRQQVEDLKRDLMAAHEAGITWKFIMIPEPNQQMGWFGGQDSWEGYALERTEVLQFIEDNDILNVVFIAADIHSTFVNNITYQTEAGGPLIPTRTWEITTGSVAFYQPTGAALAEGAAEFNLISAEDFAAYQAGTLAEKDEVLLDLFNRFVLGLQGFDPIGLEPEAGIDATLLEGLYIAGHSFGWTAFEIDAESQALTVTTYGIEPYSPEEMTANSAAILSREPQVLSRFVVNPLTG